MRAGGIEQQHLVALEHEFLPRNRLRTAPPVHIADLNVVVHMLGYRVKARVSPNHQASWHSGLSIFRPHLSDLSHRPPIDLNALGHDRPVKGSLVPISSLAGAQLAQLALELQDLHGPANR